MSEKKYPTIIIYGKSYCPYCVQAKAFFDDHGIPYEYFDVGVDKAQYDEMQKRVQEYTGNAPRTVPQIIINGQAIGGYDNLLTLNESGELDNLLKMTEE